MTPIADAAPALASVGTPNADGKRVALVIGNSKYQHGPELENPANDANDIGESLKLINFDVSIKHDLVLQDFLEELRQLGRRAPTAEMLVFFFAGYGLELDGNNYLVPIDAQLMSPGDVKREAIELDEEILKRFDNEAGIKFVVLDACRDNPFARNWKSSTRSFRNGGLQPPDTELTRIKILYSAKHGTTASDGKGEGNSPFSRVLKEKLREPGLLLNDLCDLVSNEVHRNTKKTQQPWAYGTLPSQPVYLFPSPIPTRILNAPAHENEVCRIGAAVLLGEKVNEEQWPTSAAARRHLEERRNNPKLEDVPEVRTWIDRALEGRWTPKETLEKLRNEAGRATALAGQLEEQRSQLAAKEAEFDRLRSGSSGTPNGRFLVPAVLGGLLLGAGIGWGATSFWDPPWSSREALELKSKFSATASSLENTERALVRERARTNDLEAQLGDAALQPGMAFRDRQADGSHCDIYCPEMVVLPAGSYIMGSSPEEQAQAVKDGAKPEVVKAEGPQHPVTIGKPFAVGKYEVTFAEWDACVSAGGCSTKPEDQGWLRGRRPVINVSWNDVTQQYLPWLQQMTGKEYRLLTEAEWEYAARGITNRTAGPRYSWGEDIGKSKANCNGCGSEWGKKKDAPVGSFEPNPFGLYDMHGNVLEWVRDVVDSYKSVATDGSAWTESGPSPSRVLRGGSWNDGPGDLRAACRNGNRHEDKFSSLGFRVARTLGP